VLTSCFRYTHLLLPSRYTLDSLTSWWYPWCAGRTDCVPQTAPVKNRRTNLWVSEGEILVDTASLIAHDRLYLSIMFQQHSYWQTLQIKVRQAPYISQAVHHNMMIHWYSHCVNGGVVTSAVVLITQQIWFNEVRLICSLDIRQSANHGRLMLDGLVPFLFSRTKTISAVVHELTTPL
jgi:hypothetical protein